MIAASRRRRPGPGADEDVFSLHRRLARRSGLALRLVRGSVAALTGSVLALLVGVGLQWHAVVVVCAFGLGAAAPVLGLRRRALEEIRSQAGLSYETALDLMVPASAAQDDPFGLRAAVVERARLSVADLRPAAAPAWWLPALAIALALLLVSWLDLRPGGAGGGPDAGGSSPAGSSVVPLDELQDAGAVDVEAPLEQAPGRAEQPAADDGATSNQDEDSGRTAPAPQEGSGGTAPLSRFLDSLRERPPTTGDSGGNDDAAGQGQQAAQPPGQRGQSGAGRGGGEQQRVELPSGADQGEGGDAAAATGEGEDDGSDQAAVAASEAEGGEGGDGGPEQQGGDTGGQSAADDARSAAQDAGQDGAGEQGLDAGGAAAGESGDSTSEAAGAGAAGGTEQAAGVAEGSQDRPDFLRGVLGEGTETPAGAVRLPGETDVTLPAGAPAPAEYAAAAEDALSEGDLPLSYQEIIRRYFR